MTPPPSSLLTAAPFRLTPRWSYSPERRDAIDTLVIAHDDPRLVELLEQLLPPEHTATLAIPQGHWDFRDPALAELVACAVRELPAKNLLLVAHSQGGDPEHPHGERWNLPTGGDPRTRIRRWRSQVAQAEAHFVEQLARLAEVPVADGRAVAGSLRLEGVLYRAEAGAFVAYDRARGEFRCLESGEVAQ